MHVACSCLWQLLFSKGVSQVRGQLAKFSMHVTRIKKKLQFVTAVCLQTFQANIMGCFIFCDTCHVHLNSRDCCPEKISCCVRNTHKGQKEHPYWLLLLCFLKPVRDSNTCLWKIYQFLRHCVSSTDISNLLKLCTKCYHMFYVLYFFIAPQNWTRKRTTIWKTLHTTDQGIKV